MLSAVIPPPGKIAYTTKEGDGVKSAVKVRGMEKEPFNTEEGKEKCFHHSPTETFFWSPFFCFIIPQYQTNSFCFSLCSLLLFFNPVCSISTRFLPVSPPFIVSLTLSLCPLPADIIASLSPSTLFVDCPGAVASGSSGETPVTFTIQPRSPPGPTVPHVQAGHFRLTVQLPNLDAPLSPDNNASLPSDLREEDTG